MAEALQREKKTKNNLKRQMLRDGENRWIFKETVYLREEEKQTKREKIEPDFCSDQGESLKLQNIAVLTVNYVARPTDKTKHSTYTSLSLFSIEFLANTYT